MDCKVITITFGEVLILSKLFILSCCITQVNEGTAANSHMASSTGHSVLQRAEHTTWKNELVGKINLFSSVFQLLFSAHPPCPSHMVVSGHETSAIS